MLLSEAIRKGAVIRPQRFATVPHGPTDGSCVLQAAVEGATGILADWSNSLRPLWPNIYSKQCECPECGTTHAYGTGMLAICLNDRHRWTRERIADWVEQNWEA